MISDSPFVKVFLLVNALLLFPRVELAFSQSKNDMPEVTHIEPNNETGTSMATAVGDVPLAFTNQVFPYDANGNLVGESDVTRQIDQVITHIETTLRSAGTNMGSLVRMNVYLAEDALSETVQERLAELLPDDARPAITFVSGTPTRAGVMVSMDAVAVAPVASVNGGVSLYQAESLHGLQKRSHAAVLPPGRKIFFSGQAEVADGLLEGTRKTMRGLFSTLAYAGAAAEDVVHLKAFINPAEDAEEVEEIIAGFFRYGNVPPIVTLEWHSESFPTEIEMIASAPADPLASETISYYAPVWKSQATTFSRLVDVHQGGLLFTSGLYGDEEQDGEAQARSIFATLTGLLEKAGSDYDHLVKGTYYPSTDEGRIGFTDVRTDFLNPERPPAASMAEVNGTGRAGRTINVDMISVIPE
ncbi:MAG: Rid family hydrolase [Balneolales bacterium]